MLPQLFLTIHSFQMYAEADPKPVETASEKLLASSDKKEADALALREMLVEAALIAFREALMCGASKLESAIDFNLLSLEASEM